MQLIQGNIRDNPKLDYIGITTNSILKKNGELVMGAGIAKQANELVPGLAADLGKQIKDKDLNGKFYGLLLSKEKYIAFQTKLNWSEPSTLELVDRSINMLVRLAAKHPTKIFGIPMPGCNNGKLDPRHVYPLLQKLPDNVFVYYKE